jgi:hypothetical protein
VEDLERLGIEFLRLEEHGVVVETGNKMRMMSGIDGS